MNKFAYIACVLLLLASCATKPTAQAPEKTIAERIIEMSEEERAELANLFDRLFCQSCADREESSDD